MPAFAPRISPRLERLVGRLVASDPTLSVAEITRRVGAEAEQLGLRRPSYHGLRPFVLRARRREALPKTSDVLLDVAFRVKHPDAIVQHLVDHPGGRRLP